MVHSHAFYEQYQTTFTKYTELYGTQVCVFLQKGSFYEIYGQEDPKTNIQLNTGKQVLDMLQLVCHTYPDDAPNGMTGHYGGVPISHLDKWAGKLTSQGWAVVVIDEQKNAAGKVIKRDVSQVLSPGTHLASAESAQSFWFAAIWLEADLASSAAPKFGCATADLTTGQVFLYEGETTGTADCWHADSIRHFFQVYPPRECVLFTNLSFPDTESLRRTFYIPSAPIHIRPCTIGTLTKSFVREQYMQSIFQPQTALPIRTWLHLPSDGSSRHELALTCLLRFAEDHAPSLASCLQAPSVWHPTHHVQIINNALTQLNCIGSTPDQPSLLDCFLPPSTAMGKRALRQRICTPITDSQQLQIRQEECKWCMETPTAQECLACLTCMYDIPRLHRAIVQGRFAAADCIQLVQSYEAAKQLWTCTASSPFQTNPIILQSITTCLAEFHKLFDREKACRAIESSDEWGFLQSSVGIQSAKSEGQIASIKQSANQWLQTLCITILGKEDAVSFKQTEKLVFCAATTKSVARMIELETKTLAPTHPYKQTQCKVLTSSAKVEHPSLDQFQQQYDSATATLARHKSIELQAACITFIRQTRDLWQSIEDWVTNFDCAMSFARTSLAQGWIQPTIVPWLDCTEASFLDIQNLRHPLIENQKRQSKYVTHTVQLGTPGAGNGWLVYGMNASGKSSLMKAIGIAVCLAQVGCFVPATAMTIRPFQRLATRILNQDNLWAGLSSFAVEMSELRDIVQVADHQTLVLGDELCAGTESISGTAIVAAGIEHFHKANTRFILATHLHDLMKLPSITNLPALRIYHLHVEHDKVSGKLIYHRTLRPGAGSTLYGLEVAKALHLPTDMIERAYTMRRALLGEDSIVDAKESSWNSNIIRQACTSCGKQTSHTLEVHHIQERAHATKQKRNENGTALNHVRNLVVLCEECHDAHHAGTLHIGPIEDTSEGPVRSIQRLAEYAYVPKESVKLKRKGLWSDEQLEAIQKTRTQHPSLHVKLLAFQIQREHEIQITDAQLKLLLKSGLIN